MSHREIHWPWAPVIIGSSLILLSIGMRLYDFESALINLVSSAGDIVVIFSLLYIIKIFLIDETPLPSSPAAYQAPSVVPPSQSVTSESKPSQPSVAATVAVAPPSAPVRPAVSPVSHNAAVAEQSLIDMLQFKIVDVDDEAATVTVEAHLPASSLHRTPQQTTIELMKQQAQIKDKIKSWGSLQHGSDFVIASISNLSIETINGTLVIHSTYTLGYK